ncbi:TRAP transporter small permease [Clostridium sp.]|uniref:TRAP transporter small permease n=1 Tax=Clostridium sp. TaxID=1506 RepID=UPI001A3C514C|nr:TRAP transporter small permease [Clostridium sp.]MBK5234974.1 TRAP transporter small permease [Clostridium sp.]
MKLKNKTLNALLNLDLIIAVISLIVLIIITFLGVIMRYFANNPFIWQQEVQLWCFVWIVFFGSSAAFRSGSHVAIDLVVDLLPDSLKKVVDILGYFVMMGVLIYLTIHGSNLVIQLASTNRLTNILRVPFSIIYSAFPIGCVLMMINYTLVTGISIFSKKNKVKGGAL